MRIAASRYGLPLSHVSHEDARRLCDMQGTIDLEERLWVRVLRLCALVKRLWRLFQDCTHSDRRVYLKCGRGE